VSVPIIPRLLSSGVCKDNDMNEDYCFDEALFAQVDSNRKVSESNFGISINKLSPLDISEDDDLRSRCIWHLIHNSENEIFQDTTSIIPRILIQFWDDAKAIPTDVQKCIDSWQPFDECGFENQRGQVLRYKKFRPLVKEQERLKEIPKLKLLIKT